MLQEILKKIKNRMYQRFNMYKLRENEPWTSPHGVYLAYYSEFELENRAAWVNRMITQIRAEISNEFEPHIVEVHVFASIAFYYGCRNEVEDQRPPTNNSDPETDEITKGAEQMSIKDEPKEKSS